MEQQEFDVVVVGSGAGALLAAIRAADQGLKALVVEKTALLGGTSAISGGGIWIPDNHDMPKAGLRDSVDAAFRYVKTCARGLASDDRILAYVETPICCASSCSVSPFQYTVPSQLLRSLLSGTAMAGMSGPIG